MNEDKRYAHHHLPKDNSCNTHGAMDHDRIRYDPRSDVARFTYAVRVTRSGRRTLHSTRMAGGSRSSRRSRKRRPTSKKSVEHKNVTERGETMGRRRKKKKRENYGGGRRLRAERRRRAARDLLPASTTGRRRRNRRNATVTLTSRRGDNFYRGPRAAADYGGFIRRRRLFSPCARHARR